MHRPVELVGGRASLEKAPAWLSSMLLALVVIVPTYDFRPGAEASFSIDPQLLLRMAICLGLRRVRFALRPQDTERAAPAARGVGGGAQPLGDTDDPAVGSAFVHGGCVPCCSGALRCLPRRWWGSSARSGSCRRCWLRWRCSWCWRGRSTLLRAFDRSLGVPGRRGGAVPRRRRCAATGPPGDVDGGHRRGARHPARVAVGAGRRGGGCWRRDAARLSEPYFDDRHDGHRGASVPEATRPRGGCSTVCCWLRCSVLPGCSPTGRGSWNCMATRSSGRSLVRTRRTRSTTSPGGRSSGPNVLQQIGRSPVWGYGYGASRQALYDFNGESFGTGKLLHAHNTVLNMTLSVGVVGGLIYVAMLLGLLDGLLRRRGDIPRGGAGGPVALRADRVGGVRADAPFAYRVAATGALLEPGSGRVTRPTNRTTRGRHRDECRRDLG